MLQKESKHGKKGGFVKEVWIASKTCPKFYPIPWHQILWSKSCKKSQKIVIDRVYTSKCCVTRNMPKIEVSDDNEAKNWWNKVRTIRW